MSDLSILILILIQFTPYVASESMRSLPYIIPLMQDADSGHVQMKELDADLEIIDLR
jgi:hypothetical protein